jgi:hypothetical protein
MPIKMNRELLSGVAEIINATRRVDIRSWAYAQASVPATWVGEIRSLILFRHNDAFACPGGWACFLATQEEMARAINAYGLSGAEVDDTFTITSALLIDGAKGVKKAGAACRYLFYLEYWPKAVRVLSQQSDGGREKNGGPPTHRKAGGGGRYIREETIPAETRPISVSAGGIHFIFRELRYLFVRPVNRFKGWGGQ